MTKRLLTTLCAAGFATALVASGPALAEMGQWDANEDKAIDRTEFGEGWQGSEEEMNEAFSQYDANEDDQLDVEEWSSYEDDRDEGMWEQSGHRDSIGGSGSQ
jgi:hypothetical protein